MLKVVWSDCQFLCLKVQLEVEVKFVQDTLKGDDQTEIRVKFVKKLEDAVPAGENWVCINTDVNHLALYLYPLISS